MSRLTHLVLVLAGLAAVSSAAADEVRLTADLPEARFSLNGQNFVIRRPTDPGSKLSGEFTKTARACPPFCIQPMVPITGVTSVAELEVIRFLQDRVAGGQGALIDARLPEWFAKGSIPGAVNLPFATLSAENPFRNDILVALGARPLGGSNFDFSAALELVLFCNGAWSDQSLRAIDALVALGYPVDRLHWYRGGMQDWQMLGLTVAQDQSLAQAGGGAP